MSEKRDEHRIDALQSQVSELESHVSGLIHPWREFAMASLSDDDVTWGEMTVANGTVADFPSGRSGAVSDLRNVAVEEFGFLEMNHDGVAREVPVCIGRKIEGVIKSSTEATAPDHTVAWAYTVRAATKVFVGQAYVDDGDTLSSWEDRTDVANVSTITAYNRAEPISDAWIDPVPNDRKVYLDVYRMPDGSIEGWFTVDRWAVSSFYAKAEATWEAYSPHVDGRGTVSCKPCDDDGTVPDGAPTITVQLYSGAGFDPNVRYDDIIVVHAMSDGTYAAVSYGAKIGTIEIWNSTTVKPGYHLCDGTDTTVDLRGRFIVGYYGPGGIASGDANKPGALGNTNDYDDFGDPGGYAYHGMFADSNEENNHDDHYIDTIVGSDFVDDSSSGSAFDDPLVHTLTDNRPPFVVVVFIQRVLPDDEISE